MEREKKISRFDDDDDDDVGVWDRWDPGSYSNQYMGEWVEGK